MRLLTCFVNRRPTTTRSRRQVTLACPWHGMAGMAGMARHAALPLSSALLFRVGLGPSRLSPKGNSMLELQPTPVELQSNSSRSSGWDSSVGIDDESWIKMMMIFRSAPIITKGEENFAICYPSQPARLVRLSHFRLIVSLPPPSTPYVIPQFYAIMVRQTVAGGHSSRGYYGLPKSLQRHYDDICVGPCSVTSTHTFELSSSRRENVAGPFFLLCFLLCLLWNYVDGEEASEKMG